MKDYYPPPVGVKPLGLLGLNPASVSHMSRYTDVPLDQNPYGSKKGTNSGKLELRRFQNTSVQGTKDHSGQVSNRHSASQQMLPTLGLQKYSNVDLSVSFINPYKLH